ncbi:hypothetical protein Q31b_14930 [Novipirellula aureliae]|uniref:Uncharacterized protein n=1 Tax=Novipirellula aureliae TaxID=2527966 RepID=A0A5C6E9Y1_9BACT|nr:hypothetical protein [Novipirellula aureliae]TWU43959.1 hypothetical protein Q31b_14930 [Novipirellula aureliae]
MSPIFRYTLTVAFLVAVLSSASIASASHIRNPIERRQHAERGFFVKDTGHHVRTIHLFRR